MCPPRLFAWFMTLAEDAKINKIIDECLFHSVSHVKLFRAMQLPIFGNQIAC